MLKGILYWLCVGMFVNVCARVCQSLHSLLIQKCVFVFLVLFSQSAFFSPPPIFATILLKYFFFAWTFTQIGEADGRLHRWKWLPVKRKEEKNAYKFIFPSYYYYCCCWCHCCVLCFESFLIVLWDKSIEHLIQKNATNIFFFIHSFNFDTMSCSA